MGFFEIFAESSITFAGFGALHALLQGSSGPRGNFRAWSTVAPGLLAFLLSLLPLLLDLADLTANQLWRVASGVAMVAVAALAFQVIRLDHLFTAKGHPPQALLIIRSAELCLILAVLILVYSTFIWPSPLLYGVALVLVLTQGITALLHSFSRSLTTSLEDT